MLNLKNQKELIIAEMKRLIDVLENIPVITDDSGKQSVKYYYDNRAFSEFCSKSKELRRDTITFENMVRSPYEFKQYTEGLDKHRHRV